MKFSFGNLFLLFFAELIGLIMLADGVGAWWTLGWVVAAMVLGVVVILDAGDTLQSLGGVFATPSERVNAIRETPWLLLVGLLFFVPGVISDVLALMLWVPSLRRRLLGKRRQAAQEDESPDVRAEEHSNDAPKQQVSHVVIEGEWVEKSSSSHSRS